MKKRIYFILIFVILFIITCTCECKAAHIILTYGQNFTVYRTSYNAELGIHAKNVVEALKNRFSYLKDNYNYKNEDGSDKLVTPIKIITTITARKKGDGYQIAVEDGESFRNKHIYRRRT